MEILNLDKITLKDHEVKLDGKIYKIPGSISLGTMFEIIESQQELEKNFDIKVFREAVKTIYDVFAERQPELEFKQFCKMLDMKRYGELVTYIMSIFGSESQEKKTEVQEEPEKPQK
jgi:hypothetical protein